MSKPHPIELRERVVVFVDDGHAHRAAAYLLVPYACWVGFAVILNYRIWRLNPARASS